MKKSTLLKSLFKAFAICLFYFTNGAAQIFQPSIQNIIPPAPNAASLGKFADIPVGTYTGTPQINIPIHQIKLNDFSLNISLSYHASGIKVEEIASWAGLAWSLNAGGVITRSIRGLPDEDSRGFLNSTNTIPSYIYNEDVHYDQFLAYAEGSEDSQPDIFYFNFGNHSGKFFLDKNGKAHIVPSKKFKIINDKTLLSFTIITDDGTKYSFTTAEVSEISSSCNGISSSNNSSISSWYLTEIETVNGNKITFTYRDYMISYELPSSETKYAFLGYEGSHLATNTSDANCKSMIILNRARRIHKITYKSGEIEFVGGSGRCDLPGDNVLKEILIKDNLKEPQMKFVFKYGYLTGREIKENENCVGISELGSRLVLLSVVESDIAGKELKAPYKFSYISDNGKGLGLPPRISTSPFSSYFAQDHWGYFNGILNNSTLVPEENYRVNQNLIIHLPGADKTSDESCAKVGTLNRIIYPTGGQTEFEYEIHDCINELLPPKTRKKMFYFSLPESPTSVGPYSKSFVVNSDLNPENQTVQGAYVIISLPNHPCRNSDENGNDCFNSQFDITSSSGTGYFSTTWLNSKEDYKSERVYFFPNGTYTITFTSNITPSIPNNVSSIELNWRESISDVNKSIGGLRVKKIIDYDPVSRDTVKRFFEYKHSNGNSSGSVVNIPYYGYKFSEYLYDTNVPPWELDIPTGENYWYVRSASSNHPLTSTHGSNVGYRLVTVYYGEDKHRGSIGINGKTQFTYSSPSDVADIYLNKFPFAPAENLDWKRGLLQSQAEFQRTPDGFKEIKKITNYYSIHDNSENPNYFELLGVKVGVSRKSYIWGRKSTLQSTFFRTRTGYVTLDRTIEVLTDDDGNVSTKEVNYEYGTNHLQLIKQSEVIDNEPGYTKKIITDYSYPADYSSLTSGPIYDMATDNYHLHNAVVEQVMKEEINGIQKTLSGKIVKFDYFPSNVAGKQNILPYEVFSLETNVPLNSSQLSSSKPNFNINNTFFKPKFRFNFDNYGNLVQQNQISGGNNDIPHSIIWGLNNAIPIAEIKNAKYSDVAFTSFEGGNNEGNWTFTLSAHVEAKTGSRSHLLANRNIVKGGLDSQTKYVVTFWAKDGVPNVSNVCTSRDAATAGPDGWRYFEKEICSTTQVTISGSGAMKIDELRLYPVSSLMTTYTYSPFMSITSKTDQNNSTIYYEYDGLGRLKLIKDNEGNILNSYKYNYIVQEGINH